MIRWLSRVRALNPVLRGPPPASGSRYKAFISYSHADARWAQWIHRALERYRVPARLLAERGLASNRLHPVFRDRDELSSSSSLSGAIQTALQASENLVVVCSPAAAKSRWVNEEVQVFKAMGRGARIFCLIVDGDPGSCFPPALADDEPLGADVRPQADGPNNAKLKLIAGMLGIPFGELKDREQRRRARLFGYAAAASIALAGIMTALAITAVLSGREAERNRVLAEQSLADAEAVASFLSTMLTDIDPEAIGKTIVEDMRAQGDGVALPPGVNGTNTARLVLDQHLLKKASAAVQAQFAARPTINARLDMSLGASYHAIGLYGQAIERSAHAVDLYLASFGPDDERTLLARIQRALSYLYEGRLDEAAAEYEAVVDIGTRALGRTSEPTLAAMNGLAMAYVDLARLPEARALLEATAPLMDATMGPEARTHSGSEEQPGLDAVRHEGLRSCRADHRAEPGGPAPGARAGSGADADFAEQPGLDLQSDRAVPGSRSRAPRRMVDRSAHPRRRPPRGPDFDAEPEPGPDCLRQARRSRNAA